MGCLLGCFGGRKNRRRQRRKDSRLNKISEGSSKDVHMNLRVPIVEEVPKDVRVPATVLEVLKVPEGGNDYRSVRVTSVEEVSVIPTTDICEKKAEERNSPSPTRKRVTFDSKVKTYEHVAAVEESVEEVKPFKSSQEAPCSSEGSDVASNSSASNYPSHHRYQNCRESDDEEEDFDESDLDDIDDDDDGGGLLDEDYYDDDDDYEDKRHKNWDNKVYTEEIVMEMEKSNNNTSARDRSGYVNAVLNPIENLTQWKAVKSKAGTMQTRKTLISDQERKLNAACEEPRESPKSRDETKKQRTRQQVPPAVDASLSTWLSTSQTRSISMGVQSYDERPILGALTSEEIKQFSATNSPRRSPRRSPESPITGTVGGYWNSHSMATTR